MKIEDLSFEHSTSWIKRVPTYPIERVSYHLPDIES